jgi:hypothetical protein
MVRDGHLVGCLLNVPIDWSSGVPAAGLPEVVFSPRLYDSYSYFTDEERAEWGIPLLDSIENLEWGVQTNLHSLDWSPGGDELALQWVDPGLEPDGSSSLKVISFTEAGEEVRVLAGAIGVYPCWSLDGSKIAVEGGSGIYSVRPDGSGLVRLTQSVNTSREQRYQYAPCFSPDGAYLAFHEYLYKGKSVTYNVLRVPAAGGAAVNLTSDTGNGSYPRWRP